MINNDLIIAIAITHSICYFSKEKTNRLVVGHFNNVLINQGHVTNTRFTPWRTMNDMSGWRDVLSRPSTPRCRLLTRTTTWSSPKAWGMTLIKKKGRRRAVVAVARKMAVILHRMWIDQSDFRWTQEEACRMS